MRRHDNDARQNGISTPRSRAEDDPVISLPRVQKIEHGPTSLGFQGHAQSVRKIESMRSLAVRSPNPESSEFSIQADLGSAITGAHSKVKKLLQASEKRRCNKPRLPTLICCNWRPALF